MLKLYNTLSKKIDEVPKKDHLNLYTCGPTVYNYAHIGNLRSFIMADLLFRTLEYDGYNPRWVMNITDIDDKTIKGTIAEYGENATVEDLFNFTEKYFQGFVSDLKEVNVSVDKIEFIRVTDKMKDIQEFMIGLVKKGYAYVADDGIYFSIEKYQKDFGDYGQLVGEKFLEGKKVGARVQVDEYDKESLSDFALWKFHNPKTDGKIFWEDLVKDPEVKIAAGRPGWHIECSVINKAAFNGEPTDIHTGGVDLIFPHHTNEIAQSQALLGKGNFVHHWFHSEHLLVDGKKMAKSANDFYTLNDLAQNTSYVGPGLRYLFLQAKYSTQQDFTLSSFAGALKSFDSLKWYIEGVLGGGIMEKLTGPQTTFNYEPLEKDLDFPAWLGNLQKLGNNTEVSWESKLGFILEAYKFCGIDYKQYLFKNFEWPAEVLKFVRLREEAKKNQDFAKSDELRKQIEDLGYEVMDTPEGQKIRKKL